jgi:flagellar biosynthesis/type III secretory pathway M-ring protein FliF/YscJ
MASVRQHWDDLRERWDMLGLRRQAATIVAVAVIAIAVVWLLA